MSDVLTARTSSGGPVRVAAEGRLPSFCFTVSGPVLRRLTRATGGAGSFRCSQDQGLDELCRLRPIQSQRKAWPDTVVSRVVSGSALETVGYTGPTTGVRPTRVLSVLLRKRGQQFAARGIVQPEHRGAESAGVVSPLPAPDNPPGRELGVGVTRRRWKRPKGSGKPVLRRLTWGCRQLTRRSACLPLLGRPKPS